MPRYDDDDDQRDDDDRGSRRRDVRRPQQERNWFDQQFGNTNIVILVLFALCCGQIALIFGILGVCLCKEPAARTNAMIVLGVSIVTFCLSLVAVIVQVAMGPKAGMGR